MLNRSKQLDDSSRPPPMPWEPNPRSLLAGFGLVIASVGLTVLADAPRWAIFAAAAASCSLVAVVAWVRDRDRADRIAVMAREQRRELRSWRNRWKLLHAETRQNASVLLQMTDGVIVLAPDRSILLFNPSARRLLNVTNNDRLLGRVFPEVVRIPEIVSAVRDALARQRPQEVIVEVSDGAHVRPLRVRVDRIETAAESNLLLTIRDETEARRVDEIRREFVANVSHELKTPLAAIKGYAETVELAIEDDPQAASHFMKQIHIQCVRLERLVADMMQLARAQSGPANLRMAEVSLGEVIAESLKTYHPVAERKEIELAVENSGQDATVIADREATLTIVNNLIGNAIRYTPEGGHVWVNVRSEPDHWAVVVRDDGIGIAEAEQERIFERFYRVERSRKSSSTGTGLGLSIVKNLTLAQGGEVKLRSRPGEGSTFEVWLPVPAAVESPPRPEQRQGSPQI